MKIRIICIGSLKEKYWKQAAAEYRKRLGAYCTLEIMELKESRRDDIEEEGDAILSRIREGEYVITCEIRGQRFDSPALAAHLEKLMLNGRSDLAFIIGGSDGLSARVSARSDLALSFSDMTFPHQLMRIILLEQIYRSFKIIRGEKYHK